MRRIGGPSRIGRAASVLASAAMIAALAPVPAPAATQPNAAVGGGARAAGAFVPFQVNPNFDFWPAYSVSEIDNNRSHGVSSGMWPGFLVDAFFWLFGYQPQARATTGTVETQWPDAPHKAKAGPTDFGAMCTAGSTARFALPGPLFGEGAEARPPEPMMTGCLDMWSQFEEQVPWSAVAARSESGELSSKGAAHIGHLQFPGTFPMSADVVFSQTSTRADDGRSVVSEATVLAKDIVVGSLRIGSLKAKARAVSDGTAKGARAERTLEVVDASVNGTPAVVDDSGVSIVTGNGGLEPVNDRLAAEGFDVRLVQGTREASPRGAYAESGGLVVRMTRANSPQELRGPVKEACGRIEALEPEPLTSVFIEERENPAYDPRPPYDQMPPEFGVNESVPPAVPCIALLFERAVDIGFVMGSAQASARFQPLPPPPDLDDDDFGPVDDQVFTDTIFIPGTPPRRGSDPVSPVETPPPGADVLGSVSVRDTLGADVAARVRGFYGAIVLFVLLLLAGRGGFRYLSRT